MKKNKANLFGLVQQLKKRIDKFKNNLNKHKTNEKILEGGITSNSNIKFSVNSFKPFSNHSTDNEQKYLIKISLNEDNCKEIELNQRDIPQKHKLYIYAYSGM